MRCFNLWVTCNLYFSILSYFITICVRYIVHSGSVILNVTMYYMPFFLALSNCFVYGGPTALSSCHSWQLLLQVSRVVYVYGTQIKTKTLLLLSQSEVRCSCTQLPQIALCQPYETPKTLFYCILYIAAPVSPAVFFFFFIATNVMFPLLLETCSQRQIILKSAASTKMPVLSIIEDAGSEFQNCRDDSSRTLLFFQPHALANVALLVTSGICFKPGVTAAWWHWWAVSHCCREIISRKFKKSITWLGLFWIH